MRYFILVMFAYLCGSIPFGKIVGKFSGIDIQKYGSGNIGFANVARMLGWKAGAIVLISDVGKGLIPVIIAQQYLGTYQVLAVALAAVAGHIFPVWLKFKGGKGIATGLGITLALSPGLGGLGFLAYLLCFAALKKSAPSSIIATWSLPLFCLVLSPKYALFFLGLAFLATWTHRANIRQMRKGVIRAG
jgi:glycerol-3-phosphate acyltransferase PlsY